jgi:hypothetical protein
MNGNVTREGIALDLLWMHRVGIGGLQTFDASFGTTEIVDHRLVYMSPPWQDAFRYATKLADRLNLEFGIASSPGFSESGGPWVKSEQGMKKLVWSETRFDGGGPFTGRLAQPPSVVGPFQDAPSEGSFSSFAGGPASETIQSLYRDVAVIAYSLPEGDESMAMLRPVVTSSAGSVDASLLWDGHFTQPIRLPYDKQGRPAWIEVDFGHPQTIQSMSLGLQKPGTLSGAPQVGAELESSEDGAHFRHVAVAYNTADDPPGIIPPLQETVTFSPVTARFFRLHLPRPESGEARPELAVFAGGESSEHKVTEFVLYPTPRVQQFERKGGYFLDAGLAVHATPHVQTNEVINPNEIVDVTSQLRPDGTLDWSPPAGHWAVLRIGYSLLGITNHPASSESTGLEVDKLNRADVKAYTDQYLSRYESILSPAMMGSRGLRAMVTDSFEAGPQNWTDDMPAEFAYRRGYSLRRWLPALTGRIIGSAEATDQFLWDFRRTLGELLIQNHYEQLTASLHARGMTHYGESHEASRMFIGDGMDAKHTVDVPMGSMWAPGFPIRSQETCDADIRESASVAHIYGQNLVAAETLTAFGTPGVAYAFSPENLKPTADRALADGLNLFVLHTSVHQPQIDRPPGITLGPFGQWFTRYETWAEQAGPWVQYLARSSYLLQQGHFVADIVYYYGQDSNITALYANHLPPIPEGYAFDFVSAQALRKLSVRDRLVTTASGMRYRLLAIDPRARLMSMDVLKQIAQLVAAGATVVGDKPQATPSLADDVSAFHTLADAVWGQGGRAEHRYGSGAVLSGQSLSEAIAAIRLPPDFTYSKPKADTTVWFVHRRLQDGDIYFINNRQDQIEQIEAKFRVDGKVPELWHAETGAVEPISYRQNGGHTIVPLQLDPQDAVFVVFRKHTTRSESVVARLTREPLKVMSGSWDVHFQSGRGAPDRARFRELRSWTTFPDPGIKFFSGTARYEATVTVPEPWLSNDQHLEIDLGVVKNIAEILLNGRSVGIVWKRPFRLDITRFLRPGKNMLAIRVTNLWQNRLIGDMQPNAVRRTVTTFNPYNANSPVIESGLLGPVTLQAVRMQGSPP